MKMNGYRRDQRRFLNRRSQSTVQVKRLDNYADILMDVLEQYAEEIDASIVPYNKKSTEETMMIKGLRKSSQEATNRKTHMENVEGIAVEIAKRLGLHVGATRVIARNHDVGHTFLGHSGEWWLSNVKEDLGTGYYTHNALGPAELIYRDRIYDEILERIKAFNPYITDSELSRVKKSLWLIFDGINSHNGEKTETEFTPDKEKDEAKFLEELESCFTKKGYDKGIMPATTEGCLIRLCDKISYVPYDMIDGLREGIISKIDGEYVDVLTSLGISEDEINRCNIRKNYEAIARKLQIIFTRDVIENSYGDTIRMSPEISKAMHELRNINNRRIVQYAVLKEDEETYPEAIRTLMERFSKILLADNNLQKLPTISTDTELAGNLIAQYEGTPYEGFAMYLTGISEEEYAFTKDYISKAVRQSIEDEQEEARKIVLSGEKFVPTKKFQNRDARIKRYIDYYRAKEINGEYSDEDKTQDVEEEYRRQEEQKGEYPSIEEKFSLEFGARYLSTLNDFEFFNLLKNTGLITKEQEESLTRKYKDIGQEGLKREIYVQKEFDTIIKSQAKETEKIPSTSKKQEGFEH